MEEKKKSSSRLFQILWIPVVMILGYTLMVVFWSIVLCAGVVMIAFTFTEPSLFVILADIAIVFTIFKVYRSKRFRDGYEEFKNQVWWNL